MFCSMDLKSALPQQSATGRELTQTQRHVLANINEADWLDLATTLIKTGQPDACNPLDPDMPSGSEEAIARHVAGELENLGFGVELAAALPGRPNVLGRLPGSDQGPSLILNTHLDTYPALERDRWTMTDGDPFNPTRHGDWLYARGTSDTRGNLASTIIAVRALAAAGVKLKGTLLCVYTVNEEKNGPGGSMHLFQEKGLRADAAIIAEPTAWGGDIRNEWGMSLSVANSGHCLIELVIEGVKSHIWRPDVAHNPITKAKALLDRLQTMRFSYDASQLTGHTLPTVSVVRIEAGIKGEMQFSPGLCSVVLAVVGIVPGMTQQSVLEDLHQAIGTGPADDGFTISIRPFPGSLFVHGTEPLSTDVQPCQSLRSAYRLLMGKEPLVNRKNAFNDTIRFREAGIPAVTFGPGEDSWAPDNEAISITKAVTAAKIYALAIMDFLGTEEPVG